jgi:hypothetical protein
MKIHEERFTKINLLIFSFSLITILTNVALSFFQGSYTGNWWLAGTGLLLIILLLYRGPVKFKYDTEGEVMNLGTKDEIFGKVLPFFEKHYEFPKRKLKSYKIEGWFLRRRLTIYINSRSGNVKVRTMLISHLSAAQLKSLKTSLNKYSQTVKNKNGGRKRSTE